MRLPQLHETGKYDPEVGKEIKKLEFDRKIELMTSLIVEKAKATIKNPNKKRHNQ